jgi:hypothetical protein
LGSEAVFVDDEALGFWFGVHGLVLFRSFDDVVGEVDFALE